MKPYPNDTHTLIATGQIDEPRLSEEQKYKNFISKEDTLDRE